MHSPTDETASVPADPGPRPGCLRKALVRFSVLLISVGFVFFLTEIWARTQHPFGIQYYAETNAYLNQSIQMPPDAARPEGRIFENRPDTRLELARFEYCTDGVGLRAANANREVPRAHDKQESLRLLFIGDSVTLGWGVNDEDTWIRTLEREAKAKDGRPLECLNAGHLMYNTTQQADWLEAHGSALQPDVVVLTFVTNDVEDDHWALYQEIVAAQERIAQHAPEPLGQRLVRFWAEHFPGTRRLWLFTRERIGVRKSTGEAIPVEDMPGYDEGWKRCESALVRAKRKAQELGAQFVVFDHTTPRIKAVRNWCKAQAVPVFDFTFTDAEWEQDVRVSRSDSHANPLGNHYLFEKAWLALAELDLLSAPPTETQPKPQ